MEKKNRLILFSILTITFIIFAPLITLYSLGWRIDIKNRKISQPGIFYFKVNPKNVQVFLDGKLKKKTDIFFGSLLIENLISKKYEVTIKKEGFYDWQKTLEIENKKATEAKNIVLIPKDPSFNSLFKKIEDSFFSPDQRKIILKEKDEKDWSLKVYEPEKNIKSHLISEADLKTNLDLEEASIKDIDLIFSRDSKSIIIRSEINSDNFYFILKTEAPPFFPVYFNIKKEIKKMDFNPENGNELFVLSEESLYKTDLNSQEILSFLPEKVIDYDIFKDSIYYLDSSGAIFETDFSFNKHQKINNSQIPIIENADYNIKASDTGIALKENGSLYYFDKNKNSLSKISSQVMGFGFSPDNKKIVYYNNYEIFVLFLDKEYSQPQKETGSQVFLTRFSKEIKDVFWYTDYYLIFNTGDDIKIMEIDERDRINIVDLANFKSPEIFWSQFEKKLYVLTEEVLFSSKKLIP